MAVSAVRPVVPDGTVLCGTVVPEGDGVGLPSETHLEIRVFHVGEEVLKNRIALIAGNSVDFRSE
jgi:hypothetical protein